MLLSATLFVTNIRNSLPNIDYFEGTQLIFYFSSLLILRLLRNDDAYFRLSKEKNAGQGIGCRKGWET